MKFFILITLLSSLINFGGVIDVDKTVHDWGDVSLSDGPLECSFQVKNTSSSPVTITSVVSSCGCTGVQWTKEAIAPGATGSISAKYSNDEGAYPFDKTLSVYVSGVKKPMILHLRGVVHKDPVTLENSFPVRMGQVGLRESSVKAGNMSQGEVKSTWISIANFSDKAIEVTLKSRSAQLSFGQESIKVDARSQAQISCTVNSDRKLWGKNYYYADVLCNGSKVGEVEVWAVTKEDFSSLSREEKKAGPKIELEDNTFTFKPQSAGKTVTAVFTYSASDDFKIYKIDSDSPAVRVTSPNTSPEGTLCPGKGSIKASLDTSSLEKGEQTVLLTLYTNSPLRPMVNLFITGFIQ